MSTIRKDQKRRCYVKKLEIQRLLNKVVLQDRRLIENKFDSKAFSSSNSLFSLLLKERRLSFTNKEKRSKKEKFDLFFKEKQIALQNRDRKDRNASKTRVQNRCIESGRGHAVLRFCKLSRIVFREKASNGAIPGVTKASW